MSTSEVNLITTLQNEVKSLSEKNNELKKELEQYEKGKWYWKFSFSIRKFSFLKLNK